MAYIGKNPKLKSIISEGDTLANLTLEPRKAGRFVWATDELKFYFDDGTDLTEVGSGSSGGGIGLLSKGSLITSNGTVNGELIVGNDGEILIADSAAAVGIKWAAVPSAGVPVGTMLPHGGGTIPSGYLLCNGASLDRTVYADLFAEIGTAWGTASGTHFNLPNCQGNFLRGTANGSGQDPDRNSRAPYTTGGASGDNVGSYQSGRYQSHNHSVGSHTHGGPNHRHQFTGYSRDPNLLITQPGGYVVTQSGQHSAYTVYTSYSSGTTGSSSASGGPSGGNQTAPNNINVNYVIKY